MHPIHCLRYAKQRSVTGPVIVSALLAILCLVPTSFADAMEIAILQSSNIAAYQEAVAGFKAAGPSNATYTEYDLLGDLETGKKLARKIRASRSALVVAVGLKAGLAAKLEIIDIPIVYMMILAPLKHQLTAPNMTGTLLEVPFDQQLRIIRSFLPAVQRLGMMYNSAKHNPVGSEASQTARDLRLNLQQYKVQDEKDLPPQLRLLLKENEALWLLPDSTVLTNESVRFILDTALEQRVPVIAFSPEFARLGAFLSISVSYTEVGRETARLAKRILDGDIRLPVKPVPIERLKISVNLKTANFLGISIGEALNGTIDETY